MAVMDDCVPLAITHITAHGLIRAVCESWHKLPQAPVTCQRGDAF